jgi:5-formyltetrahydrofolate cyclo-ligase
MGVDLIDKSGLSAMSHQTDLPALRKTLRKQRISLTRCQRRRAAMAVLCHLRRQPEWQRARKVALYLDAFGEVPTHHVLDQCFRLGKAVYLPVVRHEGQPLRWARVYRRQWQSRRLTRHYFGMHQPFRQRGVSVRNFDCVVMPLLGFDDRGHRLGMGGGFYDRTLAYAAHPQHRSGQHKPYRIGLAYDFQQIAALPVYPWDVAVNAVVTPSRFLRF